MSVLKPFHILTTEFEKIPFTAASLEEAIEFSEAVMLSHNSGKAERGEYFDSTILDVCSGQI